MSRNAVIKYPTTPQTRCYTLLCDVIMPEKQKQPDVHVYNVLQRDIGLARPLTMTSVQIYCLVCFERIFEIAQYLAKLQERKLSKRCVLRGTVLLKAKNSLQI